MSSGKKNENGKMKGILTDVTLCIGCERCVEACSQVNKLPPERSSKAQIGDGLSGRRYTAIIPVGSTGKTVRKQCLHCLEPSCQAACLVGAFHKREDGPVVYDQDKCIGCRYCMLACPFTIPRYQWDSPLPYIQKCKMNEDCRVEGGVPACVAACPTGSTIFGVRDDLIAEARRRIAAKPDLYEDHVYGEHEFGGTSVMYITSKDAPLNLLGFTEKEKLKSRAVPDLDVNSIPHMNHGWVLWTPFQAGLVFTGLWTVWLFRRRSELMSGPHGHDRGTHGSPEPGTAGIDEVCQIEPSRHGEEGQK